MVNCCVIGCYSRFPSEGVSFYRFPRTDGRRLQPEYMELIKKRRNAWFHAITMKRSCSIDDLNKVRIYSKHFKSGTMNSFIADMKKYLTYMY